jgi:segregation and condensation protein A
MEVHLKEFHGPMDVLVYLIQAKQVNIFNIPIAMICEEFLKFVQDQNSISYFQKAGEYLFFITRLMDIKLKMLLFEENSQEDNEDPRQELVHDILLRQLVKEGAASLEDMPQIGRDTFVSGLMVREEAWLSSLPTTYIGDPYDLILSYEKTLTRMSHVQSLEKNAVPHTRMGLEKAMELILLRLHVNQSLFFHEITSARLSVYDIIIYFMAILELGRMGKMLAEQETNYGPIFLKIPQSH